MTLYWHDWAGLAGVVFILFAYLFLQLGRLTALDLRYSGLNLAGALLIILSLLFDFNLSAFLMEAAWAAISIIGIRHALRMRGNT
jgi:paired small multidrug resistance pump